VPIYRQIIDQIKYQIGIGVLKEGDQMPSIRELAAKLAVNQNTIRKVYDKLCWENVLKTERGEGTYVSSGRQALPMEQRKQIIACRLRESVIQAIGLEVPIEEICQMIRAEYNQILSQQSEEETGEKPC
jgi:GntR family transcriptional regulator